MPGPKLPKLPTLPKLPKLPKAPKLPVPPQLPAAPKTKEELSVHVRKNLRDNATALGDPKRAVNHERDAVAVGVNVQPAPPVCFNTGQAATCANQVPLKPGTCTLCRRTFSF